jgi:hypothetical protein
MLMDDGNQIENVENFTDITFDLYSPRYLSTHIRERPISFETNDTVYYVSSEEYEDIYDFIYRCRFSKRNKQRVAFGKFKNFEEIEKASRNVYILVSGDKLPSDVSLDEKKNIVKWMTQGVFLLKVFESMCLDKSTIVTTDRKASIVSSGEHNIGPNDSCFMDLNLLFTAMTIDYYEIDSGIKSKNAQIAFNSDSNYRKAVIDKMREVFCSFINSNGGSIISQEISFDNIIRKTLEILDKYLETN